MQTSVNTRLWKKVGSPFNAALVSFLVGLLFLSALLLVTGQGLHIPFAQLLDELAWIWIGGICGVVFLTGNILLFLKLGGVQTVVLPVLGQILMGLAIDNFELFYSQQTSLPYSALPVRCWCFSAWFWFRRRKKARRSAATGKNQHQPLCGSGGRFPSLAEWRLQPKLP